MSAIAIIVGTHFANICNFFRYYYTYHNIDKTQWREVKYDTWGRRIYNRNWKKNWTKTKKEEPKDSDVKDETSELKKEELGVDFQFKTAEDYLQPLEFLKLDGTVPKPGRPYVAEDLLKPF